MSDRNGALSRLRDRQAQTRQPEAGAGKYSAATSHEMNDKYMDNFDRAYEEMQQMRIGSDNPYAPDYDDGSGQTRAAISGGGRGGGGGRDVVPAQRAAPPVRSTQAASTRGSIPIADRYPDTVVPGWRRGPQDPAGVMEDLSDRPNMCSSAHWGRGEVVIGSSDHALYIMDAVKGTRKRTLYSKTCGHSEWITTCCYLPDGRVVSGGMDSKMWMWPAGGVRGTLMEGHSAPISKVAYDDASGLVVSASYDKTVRLWNGARETSCLSGHVAPVLEMKLSPDGIVASGDRSGNIILWDTTAAGESWRIKNCHAGHVTALEWFDYGDDNYAGCFVTGGQDGLLKVWDPRDHSKVAQVELHVNERGKGALGDVCAGGPSAAGMVVTCGADGKMNTLDPRMSFALCNTTDLPNFPYSLAVAGGIAIVGLGNGQVYFVDIASGDLLYAIGANKAAVRCLEVCEDRLMCSGDDGKAMLYHF